MPHEQLDPAFPAPPYGDAEFSPRTSSRFGTGSYEDMFSSLDAQPVLSRPLMHPATGLPLTSSSADYPTFRHQRPRTPHAHCPPSPWSRSTTTLPSRPSSPTPPMPLIPLKTSNSTPTISSFANATATATTAGPPIYAPSRSSSTKSNYTFTSSTTAATFASRSSSTTSRRSGPRPGPCPLPPQPGHHNSLAELHARQANIAGVQQPISPYAEERNPLERMGYAVSGMVRRKSSGMELRALNEGERETERMPALKKKSSFARLGWGGRGGEEYGVESRRGSSPGVDVSRNF